MAALLGADQDLAEAVCAEASAAGLGPVVVANLNAPGQVVLSGTVAAVEAAARLARERGAKRAVPLRVSGAFHSPLMAGAAGGFAAELARAPIGDAAIPVACNVDAAAVRDASGLRARLQRQLVSPVRWSDCVATLVDLGAEALVEVGPAGVLTGLARRIAPGVTALSVAGLDEARSLPDRLGAAVGG
jgi:[acyl-carrier-protein] S-malonyltransferase